MPAPAGFRLPVLAKLAEYVSPSDKSVSLVQLLARQLTPLGLTDLAAVEARLASTERVVWAELGADVEQLVAAIDELAGLSRTISEGVDSADVEAQATQTEDPTASANSARLARFAAELDSFCNGEGRTAAELLQMRHKALEDACRSLLQWLVVDESAMARAEETFRQLHSFVVAVKKAHRFHVLATERASRLQRLRGAATTVDAADISAGSLVDGVAERFSARPATSVAAAAQGSGTQQLQQSADRSAELLRLLLRRASIAGMSDDEGASSDDDTFT